MSDAVRAGAGLANIAEPLLDVCDIALIDLDGVAYRGHQPIEHAADGIGALRANGVKTVFVTNNASRLPEEVAAQLTALDIATQPAEVLTAAQACARYLGEFIEPGDKVLVVGANGLRVAVAEAGYEVVTSADEAPAAVAQGFGPELGWKDLAEAAYAIQRGARHVASNLDLSLPTDRGFAPGNGSLVRAVVAATGKEPESAGKPSPAMYHMAVQEAGASRPLVIGDRLDTDLEGARSGGYLGVLVLTGVSSARDAVLAIPQMRPHVIVENLAALRQPHQAPTVDATGSWSCGGAVARIDAGRLVLDGSLADIDSVRAAAAEVWAAADSGMPVDESSVPHFELGFVS